MKTQDTLIVDGREVAIEGEPNLLELIRKAGIEIPTFCYHSELSVYGACRLCLVDIEGRGIQASCSARPESGMVVRTRTQEIREMRKISVELLLANHDMDCPTCPKSRSCKLQDLAHKLGVDKVRFKRTHKPKPVDHSSPCLTRDPNKCVLCGDCVRACYEIQGIGAIDFVGRGTSNQVMPAFGKDLNQVECVGCGQCAAVCPTGALSPKREVNQVWRDLENPAKTVVVQIAPAVRAGLGEFFGSEAGATCTGKTVAALKALGFDQVYDTCFAADLTVIEEANEFIQRKTAGERLPQFTSCCPAWVKFTEQFYPELRHHLSTCRSPQQMFGSMARELLPNMLGVKNEDLVVVSIMPCTAKKFEAKLDKFIDADGVADVDHVVTTQGLARMIEEAGIDFANLPPESFDMPMGFRTGAGILFGASGGVSEAVLRYAVEKISDMPLPSVDFHQTRGEEGIREVNLEVNGMMLKLCIVHGLANARTIAEQVKAGQCDYDLIEVMTCPGGCVAGAGQPVSIGRQTIRQRAQALYNNDKTVQIHKSQDNFEVARCYSDCLGDVGGDKAHKLLHTHYQNRRAVINQANSCKGAPALAPTQATCAACEKCGAAV